MQSLLNEPDSTAWSQIAPLLEEALNCLGEKEHDAVVLRFFSGKELKHIGEAMGTTEDGARMRVNRGLEKLRKFFIKRGVTLSSAAIAGAVSGNSVQAAPAALIPVLTKGAIAATATPVTALATTKVLAIITLQKAIVVVILLLWAAGSAIFMWPPIVPLCRGAFVPLRRRSWAHRSPEEGVGAGNRANERGTRGPS
jgi:hypothetical protein